MVSVAVLIWCGDCHDESDCELRWRLEKRDPVCRRQHFLKSHRPLTSHAACSEETRGNGSAEWLRRYLGQIGGRCRSRAVVGFGVKSPKVTRADLLLRRLHVQETERDKMISSSPSKRQAGHISNPKSSNSTAACPCSDKRDAGDIEASVHAPPLCKPCCQLQPSHFLHKKQSIRQERTKPLACLRRYPGYHEQLLQHQREPAGDKRHTTDRLHTSMHA